MSENENKPVKRPVYLRPGLYLCVGLFAVWFLFFGLPLIDTFQKE
jgi:hypothetical protein